MESTLKIFAAVAALQLVSAGLAPLVLPATTLLRTPQYDSAIIQSDRVGGSFAYSTIEGHSYQAVSPLVRSAYQPVEIRYNLNSVPLSYDSPSYYVPSYVFSDGENGSSAGRPSQSEADLDDSKRTEENDTVSVESA
ncbi:uncharacterized protein LOC129942712 [Eupeodes corollae]|uniref:uncharacterized protein LOC129942712 n=1 Tax=Eupeodes corollae TaxID=290404 RepID=UPI0024907851|nr:uncharacterized protein LOC129942712 [Eupeodes corollae]